ncbi:MAG: hypothetical protein LDL44_02775 [Caenispirillum sp.]|nr:hypothetical protein [Caenispirillum sp.]
MADIVKFEAPSSRRGKEPPSAAEQHRKAAYEALGREAAAIERRLSKSKVSPLDREAFALAMGRMFRQLDEKGGGLVARALAAVQGGDISTKRRGRFSRTAEAFVSTRLCASGAQWCALTRAVGDLLRGPDRAFVDLVAGTSYASATAPLVLSADLADDAAETAALLQELAAWVSRRNDLPSYYAVLRNSDYEFDDEAGEFIVADVVPEAADPDALADGLWFPREEAPRNLPTLPRVALYRREDPIQVKGTTGSMAAPPLDEAQWQALAEYEGVETVELTLYTTVSLSVAPLDPQAGPTACFVIEPRFKRFDVSGHEADPPALEVGRWNAFPHGPPEAARWSALRVDDLGAQMADLCAHAELVATVAVTAESCARYLGRRPRYGGQVVIDFHSDECLDTPEESLPPTAAPSRTLMAAVQGNLAHAPPAQKLSTRLDASAARLVRLLTEARREHRKRYDYAIDAVRASWRPQDEEV